MKKYPFSVKTEEDVILIRAFMDENEVVLVLDTAATQTVIDLNALLIMGYQLPTHSADEIVHFETSNGTLEAKKMMIGKFSALGSEQKDYEIFTYDFLLAGITSPYDGVLGLDFFKNSVLTIDFQRSELWVTPTLTEA